MKTVLLALFALTTTLTMYGQLSFTVQKVDASAVPQVVLDAQANAFPGVAVKLWEKQTATGPKSATGARYVATFTVDGSSTRARYYANGKGISATSYMLAAKLPQAIQDAAKTNYPDYTLMSGEKIKLMSKGTFVYRVRLRKGAQKLVVYMDETGKVVSKDSLPSDVTEDESAPQE